MDDNLKCEREKYWPEMDDKQKIEKLQRELARTQQQLATISDYVEKFMEHEHTSNGHIVIRLKHPYEESFYLKFRAEKFNK